MGLDQAKRLKELERENSRSKRALTDLTLDNLILKQLRETSKHRTQTQVCGTRTTKAGHIRAASL